MNSFGHKFRISLFGESHGEAVGVVIDGCPSGIALSVADFETDLVRRRGGAEGTTKRRESDVPHIVSGVYRGFTSGAPIAIVFRNEDTQSADYDKFSAHPRPSHADRTAQIKASGYNDPRGGGHFSGRLTLELVAAGVIAKKILGESVEFSTKITEIGGATSDFENVVREAQTEGDSVGGVIECVVTGVCAGLGEPFFDSVESMAAHLLFSIPAVKGVEFGAGFEVANRKGSENNDLIIDEHGTTATNNDGGINGGITNGNPIVVRVAVKPTPSIAKAQNTYNFETHRIEPLVIEGRHDTCIALRAAVVVEAAMAITLAELI